MKSMSEMIDQTVMSSSTVANRAWTMWSMRLHSAFRTALACAIVAGMTLYTPKFIHSHVKFATFSYLTALTIVSDASLGEGFRGCWHALCATLQVVPIATLLRWLVDPKPGVPVFIAAGAMTVGSFLVALPESTHITTKRIAFGQIVLVCADAVFSSDGLSPGYMHPIHVATSTATGVLAALLALSLPFPDLAHNKVGVFCRIYAENASERINMYLRAFSSRDNLSKKEVLSEAKPIAETGAKLMQSIKDLQDGIRWERPSILSRKLDLSGMEDRLQHMELPLRGMEYSLVSSPALRDQLVGQEQVTSVLQDISVQLQLKVAQFKHVLPTNSKTGPAMEQRPLLPLEDVFPVGQYEWVYFFFSCVDMLLNDNVNDCRLPKEVQIQLGKTDSGFYRKCKTWILKLTSRSRLEFAFKCSVSLGLAVLVGLIFDKENGVWAGLTIAISFVNGKQAVFTVANTRAQGTAMGSAYGIICRFLFRYPELRLLSLLPWVIFTCFLRNSRMYGQTGGLSAAVGALLILGRKNFGDPHEFAIARLTEVFIGLSCFIAVELSLQHTRAASLADDQLYQTLRALQECIEVQGLRQKKDVLPSFLEMKDKQNNLKSQMDDLKKLVADAEMEPDFWFLPFPTTCYQKLLESMSNMMDMLYFIMFNMEKLQESANCCDTQRRNELQEHMSKEVQLISEALSSSLKYLEKKSLIKSSSESEAPTESLRDLESGEQHKQGLVLNVFVTQYDEAEGHNREEIQENKELNERTVQCLGALRFCISALRKETEQTEIHIRERVRWVNHSVLRN